MEDAQPTAAVDQPSLPCSGDLAPVSDDYAAAATDAGESKPEGGAVDAVQVNGSVIAAETMIYQTQGSAIENGSVAGYPLEQQYEEAYSLEEERLWNLVGENSLDFDAWTALIDETEKVSQCLARVLRFQRYSHLQYIRDDEGLDWLNIVDGKMQYLFDEDGRRYLDAFAGIATVCCGHCHPEVVEAIINQTKRLQHSTVLYLNHAVTDFAEALASKLPGDLKVVFFTISGTEANELAMMISRLYTGSHDIISLRNAYHGNASGTMGATAQSNWKFNVIQSGVHHAVNPDPYRGLFGSDGEKYARDIQEIIDFGTSGGVAAFFSESIQGVGGIVELAPGYLPAAYEITRKAGGLCIADEVQTGFARTGSHFWGFESHGVVPDIVTIAKGIGNGIPIGAVVTTP